VWNAPIGKIIVVRRPKDERHTKFNFSKFFTTNTLTKPFNNVHAMSSMLLHVLVKRKIQQTKQKHEKKQSKNMRKNKAKKKSGEGGSECTNKSLYSSALWQQQFQATGAD